MSKLSIELSNSDFKYFITNNKYYIDKTLFIDEIMSQSEVLLFPRPRRFGKTLNLSMLQYFFDINENSRALFDKFKISKSAIFNEYLNKYPVIFITLKSIKEKNWESSFNKFKFIIAKEYKRHDYLLKSEALDDLDKKLFNQIINKELIDEEYGYSMKLLSEYLYKHHKKQVVILLDEYDTPIHAGFSKGYYDEVIDLMRSLIGETYKENPYLFKGVITGILRVAKESIFSGANNIKVFTLLNRPFSDKFGFLDLEVKALLEYFNITNLYQKVKNKYSGYTFGDTLIYNPWAIMNFVNNINNNDIISEDDWVKSGGTNNIIKDIIFKSTYYTKEELISLLHGNTINKEIDSNISFPLLYYDEEVLWSFLLFTGYLTYIDIEEDEYKLKIPNSEIKRFFKKTIINYLKGRLTAGKYLEMLQNLVEGKIDEFAKIFKTYIEESIGSNDPKKEWFYHSFTLGMLMSLSDKYIIDSNEGSGHGRYDIMLLPKEKKDKGIIIEIKSTDNDVEKVAEDAIKQIKDKKYVTELNKHEIKDRIAIGIAFKGKEVAIKSIQI